MKKLILLAALVGANTCNAEWRSSERVDPMTDKVNKMAIAIHPSKEIAISFTRRPSGAVWGTIVTTKDSFILISHELPPMMRLDKHPASPVVPPGYEKLEQMTGKQFYSWSPSSVSFMYWHGSDEDGPASKMENLVNSKEMQVRIFQTVGGAKDYSIDMTGAKEALCKSLDLTDIYCQ